MRRLHTIILCSLISIPQYLVTSCNSSSAPGPNIVLILTEDICPDLGCYGRTDLKTPNLDSLARQGALFTNAFSTSPVCSASRSALMTGMYQTTTGMHNHRSNIGQLNDSIPLLTHILREQGYFVCNTVNSDYGDGKTDLNFEAENLFDGDDWSQRKTGQPFFAQISIYTTHRDIHWEGIENEVQNPVDPFDIDLPSYYPDHPVNRLDWARYLNSIQYMDKQVGLVLDRIRREGLEDNTVVIFTSDHGRCMVRGKQWLYDSGIHIPLIIRWPGKIAPESKNDNLVSMIDITASILEIAGAGKPTLMQGKSLLGDGINDTTHEIFAARDRCDAVIDRIRCVRTKDFKLIWNFQTEKPYDQFGHYKSFFYPGLHLHRVLQSEGKLTDIQESFLADKKPEFELYDVKRDPEETINLAGMPDYTDVLLDLKARLEKWIVESNDQGAVGESREFLEDLQIQREEKYGPLWESRGINPNDPPELHLEWWKQNLDYYSKTKNEPMELAHAQRELFRTVQGKELYAYIYFPDDYPSRETYPAIVFFHGGGWRKGKSTQFSQQSEYLASRGMIAIQADYRTMLRDEVTPFECVEDARAAISWVRENAARLQIDPNMIAAGGGSAGGHLAAAVAMIEQGDRSDKSEAFSSIPDALVLFNPVINNGPDGYRFDLFGDRFMEISPYHNIKPGQPPVILFLGTEDEHLSVNEAHEFKNNMITAGNYCEVRIYEGQKHGFFNMKKGGYPIYAQTVREMDRFLTRFGYLSGEPTIELDEKIAKSE